MENRVADKNLILALTTNYGLDLVAPFLLSARKHCANTDIVLMQANMPQDFHDFCQANDITLLPCDELLKLPIHIQSARYFMTRNVVAAIGANYGKILISDIRDVVFQGDCFAPDLAAPLVLAAEDGPISSEPWNTRWILNMYGQAMFEAIGDKTISCSGTTFGTPEAMLNYLDLMCAEIIAKKELHVVPCDQGPHNVLYHTGQLPQAHLDLENALVATVGIIDEKRLTIEDGQILVDGKFSPVVHQWDRHDSLKAHVEGLYVQPLR